MKRVGILSGSFVQNVWNGLGRHTSSLASGLSKDYNVTVFAPSEHGNTYKEQKGQILLVKVGLQSPKKTSVLTLSQVAMWNKVLTRVMKEHDFDILILPNCDGYGAAKAYVENHPHCKTVGFVPYLYKSANWIDIPDLRELLCSLEKDFLQGCNILIAHSEFLAECVANESQREVDIIPSTEMFTDRMRLREEKKGHVCYVGRMNKSKSIETLLRAVAAIPEITLTLTSPENTDRYVDRLRNMATTLGIADRVHMLGWMNSKSVRLLYTHCELAVVTGIYEPYGHSVIDPMSIGTRVIVSEFSGLCDYLAVPENRYTNTASLIAILKQKLDQPLSASIAERVLGMRHAQKHFDTSIVTKSLEMLLCTL